jgi:hypothetical protein
VKENVPRNSMLLIVVLQDLTVYPPCLCSFHCFKFALFVSNLIPSIKV